jgi:hypothetical protein
MLLFVTIIVAVGLTQPRNDERLASRLPAPTQPLWKPEPGRLLAQPQLALTSSQQAAIQNVESKWESEKAGLLSAMAGFTPKQGRSDQIKESLVGYSELSRTYDETRERYWETACRVLDKTQRAHLAGGGK